MLSKKQCQKIYKKAKKYSWFNTKYIKQIQAYLNKCGAKLSVDGIFGYYTINAVYAFQKKYKLTKDALPGAATLSKLKKVVTARQEASIYMTASDWKKSKYFKQSEFKCNCVKKGLNYCDGYPHKVTKKLVAVETMIRKKFNSVVINTSGLRCTKYNDSLKGSIKNSKHKTGEAADCRVSGVKISKFLAYCKALKNAGYIAYFYTNNSNMKGVVHINV